MPREFDHGRVKYAKQHRISSDQHTRHILGNDLMSHYGSKPENYKMFSEDNYRMGSSKTNGIDTRIDNALIGEFFKGQGDGYDRLNLTQQGISNQQQLNAIGRRFDVAKQAYETTREYKYFMMQKDLRYIAESQLNADLRGFKLSNKF